MPTYAYQARNIKTDTLVKADVQADSEAVAAKLVTAEGLVLLKISLKKARFNVRRKRIRTKDKVLFSRQLSTLINAGLPLVQSLHTVAGQTTNKSLKTVITTVITDVEAGSSFHEALAKHPKVFDTVYVSLVTAGEASGTLDAGLERLANQQEKDAEIARKVKGAMIYPVIILFVMFGVVFFMVIKVLPQVQTIYQSIPGAKLPFLTSALLGISNFVIHKWWVTVIVVAAIAYVAITTSRTAAGKSLMDTVKMKAWPIDKLFMKLYMARFARTGTTLVGSGVPLVRVLEITAQAVNNVHIGAAITRATQKVKSGKPLSEAIKDDENFLELVPNMLHIGEQSGATENMLEKIASYYEKEVDDEIKAVSTIIEPVLMILIGVMALIVVAAVLLPIYTLTNQSGFSADG